MIFSTARKRESLDFIILSVLADEPLYGYAIIKAVGAKSDGEIRLTPGVLYPALHELEQAGLVTANWETVRSERSGESSGGRRRKWYRLTAKGKRRWQKQASEHRSLMAMIQAFLPRTDEERA